MNHGITPIRRDESGRAFPQINMLFVIKRDFPSRALNFLIPLSFYS